MKVYETNGKLVSLLNDSGLAITQSGDIITVNKGDLIPSKLYRNGIYDVKFIQAAIGGLRRLPFRVGRLYALDGFDSVAYVEPLKNNLVKFAIGLPAEAFGPGAEALADMKINKDKVKDYDKDKPKKEKSAIEEVDELDKLGDGSELNTQDDTPTELRISDTEEISNIQRLVLEWDGGVGNISIEDIKQNFGENKFLPEPDVVKIVTDNESIVRRKSKPTTKASVQNITKKSYYGPTPIMYSTCPKCQSKLFIDSLIQRKENKTIVKCSNPKCNFSFEYEGDKLEHGVSGQTKTL